MPLISGTRESHSYFRVQMTGSETAMLPCLPTAPEDRNLQFQLRHSLAQEGELDAGFNVIASSEPLQRPSPSQPRPPGTKNSGFDEQCRGDGGKLDGGHGPNVRQDDLERNLIH